jgi:hypothetical protein
MKRIITFTVVSVLCFITVSHTNKKHDEGMFLLSDLKNIDLKKIGMDITPEQLYNPKGTSLIDAIVRVGGCTGSFVSENGLIVTNHHCAFSFVQAISDTQNNFIKNGFLARNPKEEVLAKGLVCRITASYEDVSHKILQETYRINDPQLRSQIITKNIKAITDYENKNNPGLQCEISEMFTGRTYVLFRYKLLKDVRMVYVPARSVGEYGGELDNWVWPRHSGDFAFLRAYVAPDGSSAEYNVANVPYKPAKHLKVNPNGVRENDFVFVLGYPGRTYRHQPAKFFQYHEQYLLKYVSDLYDWQINTMQELSLGNEALAIKYAGKEKSLANVTKNYKGKMQGFSRSGLTKQKFEDEQQLQQFIDADDYLKQKYANIIPRINQLYDTIIQFAQRNLWYDYIYNVSPTLLCAAVMDNYADEYRKLTTDADRKVFMEKQTPRLKAAIARYVGLYDKPFEQRALVKMIKDALKHKSDNRIAAIDQLSANFKTDADIEKYVASIFAKTVFNNPIKANELFTKDSLKFMLMKDPIIMLASALNEEMNMLDAMDRTRESELSLLMAKYVDAKSEWKSKQFVPDANGTLRFTYGYVKGYSPNDGEFHKPFTTLRGVIEKESPEYELLAAIKELYAQKDYGDFIHPDLGDLPVNILYNLDTTGGNSGSPVMDKNGDLIAVNFDRAYTATINDYAWNESYSRSVAVDIRYVLWVTQKVAKADYLLQEMQVLK